MTTPRFAFVPVMDHEIHVTEWGAPGKPALMMMHGLARTGRDFDELAAAMCDDFLVLCPDMIGRGKSSWASDPGVEYSIEYAAGIIADLLDHYGIERTAWLGTSMGGQIGVHMASGKDSGRIERLILNDIGPEVPLPAIERIMSYVGELPHFTSHSQAETWLRSAYAPFGPAADSFWQRMARTSTRRCPDGRLTLHYDAAILHQFTDSPQEMTAWDRWTRITVPTHVIGGARSDLLTDDIRNRMRRSGPKPEMTLLDDCGHAPSLSRPQDISTFRTALATLAEAPVG
ncbi:alpha/beta hydrolase [Sulfitobacter alexandrii]|uniref:Alpha/beta hydrolase n=1 Tax=Sulfitobacter alexandrii TaxID=1917485 RepID=A0A1J0WGJ4_9RHOB|nr:alpha/beta hydrolase [Sulfitobacter alexandrii]APE43439.1 alpha/beta hydrolase [Sulfitobacter alexandrii]